MPAKGGKHGWLGLSRCPFAESPNPPPSPPLAHTKPRRLPARSPLAYGYVCGKYTWADPHGNGAEGRGVRAANVKRYDRRKLQALRILHEELENVRARASLHGRGFALSHTSHCRARQ